MNVIYLAAGFSRRFGSNKLLYPLDGKPIYQHTLDRLISVCQESEYVQKIIVVTQYDEIMQYVEAYRSSLENAEDPDEAVAMKDRILAVRNAHSERGISSSLQSGLQADDSADAYLCCVADQPYLKKETIQRFIEQFRKDARGIGCMAHDGVYGNPVIFSAAYREELLQLHGDKGGKQIVSRHMEDVMLYETAESQELTDIDQSVSGLEFS